MERISRVVGPVATNVYVLADPRSREAIVDTAVPSLDWIPASWRPRVDVELIVDARPLGPFGGSAAVQAHTGADIAVHCQGSRPAQEPGPLWAPFEIPAIGAGGRAHGGRRDPLRRGRSPSPLPGPRKGPSASTWPTTVLFSGDTLFAGAWGRTDLPAATPVRWSSRPGPAAGL